MYYRAETFFAGSREDAPVLTLFVAGLHSRADDVTITGQVSGLAKVVYNRGTCNVQVNAPL